MNRKMRNALGLAAALSLVALPLEAQRGPRAGNGGLGIRANGVERALGMRERLELSEDQVTALNQLRQENLERQQSAAVELMRIRSDIAAGELTRAEARDLLEGRRDEARDQREASRDVLQEVLSEDQLDQLLESTRRGRRGPAGVRGRRGRGGGQGFRGGRGFRRGPGFSGGRGFRRDGLPQI